MWDGTLNKAKKGKIPEMAAKLWDADPTTLKLIHEDHNLLFSMKSHGKNLTLRITHPLIRSHTELTAAIHYRQYLFEKDAPVCQPLKSTHANDVEEISWFDDTFLVYANEKIQGEAIHFDHHDKKIFESWGKSLAHLHRVAKSYHPGEQHQFLYWHDLWEETARFVVEEEKEIQQEYRAIDEWFSSLNKSQHDFGLIHGDHQRGNAFYDGHQVRINDFDEPVYHWFCADMARPFQELSHAQFDLWKAKAMWFLDGYYTIASYEEDKINHLPWFIRMKNMEAYLWLKNRNVAVNNNLRNVRLAELRESICRPVVTWE